MKSPCWALYLSSFGKAHADDIFLYVLAYQSATCHPRALWNRGVHTSWWTLREQLSTPRSLPWCCRQGGKVLKILQGAPLRNRSTEKLCDAADTGGGHERSRLGIEAANSERK